MSEQSTHETYELNGKILEPGVGFKVTGNHGLYSFVRHVVKGEGDEWIECYGGKTKRPMAFHAFPPDRLLRVLNREEQRRLEARLNR